MSPARAMVGKTTLALQLVGANDPRHPAYLSWDDIKARPRIRRGEMPPGQPRVVLDEIHKYARWRGLVKGLYDTRERGQSFLITGSARLDGGAIPEPHGPIFQGSDRYPALVSGTPREKRCHGRRGTYSATGDVVSGSRDPMTPMAFLAEILGAPAQ